MRSSLTTLLLLCPLLVFLVGFDVPIDGEGAKPAVDATTHEAVSPTDLPPKEQAIQQDSTVPPATDSEGALEFAQPPLDPCLPALYRDWREFSREEKERGPWRDFAACRIIITRETFHLIMEGIRSDGSAEEIYETHVALGTPDTPTPAGRFLINHIYCYPDVIFYDPEHEKIPALYNGFFAPLLVCDDQGNCGRFRELGIHGYDPTVYQHPVSFEGATYGGVSSGCIRIPNPCEFKTLLIRAVGIGPMRRNDRGCYHWLDKPVEVFIVDEETTLVSLVRGGLAQIGKGLKKLLGGFWR